LIEAGFLPSAMGLQLRVPRRSALMPDEEEEVDA
jgi:hypothetical protein